MTQAIVYSVLYKVQKPKIDDDQFLVFFIVCEESVLRVCEKQVVDCLKTLLYQYLRVIIVFSHNFFEKKITWWYDDNCLVVRGK